ncbi:MAG TPA: type II toxin-antitoxin system RelE/ParE family toxin [Bdellovibrionota bacterium]|nr:type II toxin-antitoxin system RelE/ParE family toxin [Bdellovibrionota bacterium]
MRILQLPAFREEMARFSEETREDIWLLVDRFLKRERLPHTSFKTFSIDKQTRIQEFKVKDYRGNWRAISCIHEKELLVFVYAFHKKSQALQEKDKRVIRQRVQRIPYAT